MNQIAVIDRGAAARKAWDTRRQRAQGSVPSLHGNGVRLHEPRRSLHDDALAAFEREANSESPDWHRAALMLKRALASGNALARTKQVRETTCKPNALPSPPWPDYLVDHLTAFKVRNPTIVVTFADGEVVRAPAVSAKNKPVNVGRGLRVAIAFYQARACRRAGLPNLPGFRSAAPSITSCTCEDTGEIFDAEQCTIRTAEVRKRQDWRCRDDGRRIEAYPGLSW